MLQHFQHVFSPTANRGQPLDTEFELDNRFLALCWIVNILLRGHSDIHLESPSRFPSGIMGGQLLLYLAGKDYILRETVLGSQGVA